MKTKLKTFTRTWKNAETNPPKEAGRYWCIVKEVFDSEELNYQWNCAYNKSNNPSWTDNNITKNVIWWTELAPNPF